MKLFIVAVHLELYVVAENKDDALDTAVRFYREEEPSLNASEVLPGHIPYDGYTIPYGETDPADPDRTVQGWMRVLKEQEDERRRRAGFEARQGKLPFVASAEA